MDIDSRGLAFPLRLGGNRNLALVEVEDDVRAMLEQILLTSPGERINRPTFGVGLLDYVFEPDSPFLASRLRVALDQNVYEYLGRTVKILGLDVESVENELTVRVQFQIAGTISGPQQVEFRVPTRGGG